MKPGGDNEDFNVNGLTLDTVYYVIVQDSDYIKLAANATDAANGIFITLSDGGWSTNKLSLTLHIVSEMKMMLL